MRGVQAAGDRIIELRKARGLTQEALAARAECDVKTIRSSEKCRCLDVHSLRRIARALGAHFRDIVRDATPTSDEHANLDTIRRYFDAFNARDARAMTAFYDDDAVLVLSSTALGPSEETFHGKGELLQKWQTALSEVETEPYTPDNLRLDAVRDYVFARGVGIRLRGIATGWEATASYMCEFQLHDGKIVRQMIVYDTLAWESLFDRSADSSNLPVSSR
jgi:ketosteroid isomerase-like protein